MPKKLTDEERAAMEAELSELINAQEAMGDGLPYGFLDDQGPIEMLGDKATMKELATCFKTAGVDGSGFLAAAKALMAEWKILEKAMAKRGKELDRQIAKIEKKVGV